MIINDGHIEAEDTVGDIFADGNYKFIILH